MGDWVMASGEAKLSHAKTGKPVCFVGRNGHGYWSEVFEHNPKIMREPGPGITTLTNQGGGQRPYIQYKTPHHWVWRAYKPEPGEFYFTDYEIAQGKRYRGHVIIEPNVKPVGHNNKDWGRDNWEKLARIIEREVPLAQFVGPANRAPIDGVKTIPSGSFREAAAVLKFSQGAVLPEGGLHHAAAAVGLPSVVIYGEFISPKCTGYDMHRNLFHGEQLGCGLRVACGKCRRAMDRIQPGGVAAVLRDLLNGQAVQRSNLSSSHS